MSDPVTNIEIEDVLSSIRRLMIDGDKARADVLVPNQIDVAPIQDISKTTVEVVKTKLDKFVLTPAFMVMSKVEAFPTMTDSKKDVCDEEAVWVEELCADQNTHEVDMAEAVVGAVDRIVQSENGKILMADSINVEATDFKNAACDDASQLVDVPLTEIAKILVNEAGEAGLDAVTSHLEIAEINVKVGSVVNGGQTFDRSNLIASIAELEAAVTNDVHDFEPHGIEGKVEALSETVSCSEPVVRSIEVVQGAKKSSLTTSETEIVTDNTLSIDKVSTIVSVIEKPKLGASEQIKFDNVGGNDDECYGDDDLDGLLDVGNVLLDQDALRSVISEVVREELEGPLGKRITSNLRKLVHREIYRILSSKEHD
ncbi:MAG: hypothetical protein ACI9RO_000223 [Alteromonas macleodii]|jgi:hypothetical protein